MRFGPLSVLLAVSGTAALVLGLRQVPQAASPESPNDPFELVAKGSLLSVGYQGRGRAAAAVDDPVPPLPQGHKTVSGTIVVLEYADEEAAQVARFTVSLEGGGTLSVRILNPNQDITDKLECAQANDCTISFGYVKGQGRGNFLAGGANDIDVSGNPACAGC